MPDEQAQLIFVAGPQAGQRVVLDGLVAVLGRSAECDVVVHEPYVSRRHAELRDAPEGITLESLSPKGIRIGAKTYRAGTPVLLATGDVLSLGADTQLLFVAAGDDAQLAEAAWRQAQQPPPVRPGPRRQAAPPVEPDAPAAPARPASRVEQVQDERRRRTRRIMIGLGIYGLVVVVLFGVAAWYKSRPRTEQADVPPARLTGEEILAQLQATERSDSVNPVAAQKALGEARELYDRRRDRPNYLFLTVRQYNRYKSLSGADALPTAEDLARYQTALGELGGRVTELYNEGYIAAEMNRWVPAQQAFSQVLELLKDDPQNAVYRNALAHLTRVERQIARSRKTDTRYFQ